MLYSTSNVGVTLKFRLRVIEGHWKWHRSTNKSSLSPWESGRPAQLQYVEGSEPRQWDMNNLPKVATGI